MLEALAPAVEDIGAGRQSCRHAIEDSFVLQPPDAAIGIGSAPGLEGAACASGPVAIVELGVVAHLAFVKRLEARSARADVDVLVRIVGEPLLGEEALPGGRTANGLDRKSVV